MPVREQLGKKQIHYDAKRLRTALGVPSGIGSGGTAHNLLSAVHLDTETAAPDEGALILANSTSLWDILLHPGVSGVALVTDDTTWTADITPLWEGIHTFGVGKLGESLAWHCSMGEGHGIGGITVVAPCASLRTTIVV